MDIGNIRFQEDGTALVAVSFYLGSTGAGGRTYVVERIGDNWQVIGDTGFIWIS